MFSTWHQPTHLKPVRGHYLIRLNYLYEQRPTGERQSSYNTWAHHRGGRLALSPASAHGLPGTADGAAATPDPRPLQTRSGPPRPLAVERRLRGGGSERAMAPARSRGNSTARPIPGRRQPRRAPKGNWKGRHARPPGAAEGARRGWAAAAPPFPRKPRRGQRSPHKGGPQAAGKFSAAAGETARSGRRGRPSPAANKSENLYSQSTARHSRTPRRRLPVPRLAATARQGPAAPGRGWLGASFSARAARRAEEGGRGAPAEGAGGERARTWRRRAWARVPRWGAGSGRRPSRTGCHYFARGGSGRAARAGPPGSTRRAAPLREQGPRRLPSPPPPCHFLRGRWEGATLPRTGVAHPSEERRRCRGPAEEGPRAPRRDGQPGKRRPGGRGAAQPPAPEGRRRWWELPARHPLPGWRGEGAVPGWCAPVTLWPFK